MPRREVARRLLDGRRAARAARRGPRGRGLRLRPRHRPGDPRGAGRALSGPASPTTPPALTTDWQPALAEALKADAGAPVLGVVLLTDGRQNAPGDPRPTVDRLAARGMPVFPVLIGSTRPPRDAAIAAVKAPESVYKGDVATVEATLKLDGYAGREVAVTLDRPGASPLAADGPRPGRRVAAGRSRSACRWTRSGRSR